MRKRLPSGDSGTSPRRRTGGGCFALIWCGFSSLFIIIGVLLTLKGMREAAWVEVACEIEELSIASQKQEEEPFVIETRYRYQHEGIDYTSDQFSTHSARDSNYQKLYERMEAARERSTCHYNPDNPDEAALADSPLTVLSGLILAGGGVLFFAIGLFAVFSSKKQKGAALSSRAKPPRRKGSQSRLSAVVFSLLFVIGLVTFLLFCLPSLRKIQAAKSWPTAPATVIWSEVRSHQSDDGTTYSIDIFYRYRVGGSDYRSNKYKFLGGSSSSRQSKTATVREYPPGHRFQVFVNPAKPYEAVINPKLGWGLLLLLIPAPFILIGAIGLGSLVLKVRSGDPQRMANLPERLGGAPTPASSGRGSRIGKFCSLLFFALFWNGILSVFLYQMWQTW